MNWSSEAILQISLTHSRNVVCSVAGSFTERTFLTDALSGHQRIPSASQTHVFIFTVISELTRFVLPYTLLHDLVFEVPVL